MGNDELKVMRYMYDHSGITARNASHELNIERLGARIFDLKRKGIPIDKITVTTEEGKRHAKYFLPEAWRREHDRP